MQNFTAILLNLDRDTARLTHMQAELKTAGIAFERHAGILGNQLPDDLTRYFFTPEGTPKTGLRRGELGCYASHLRSLIGVASGLYGPMALIMEDDLRINPGFLDLWAKASHHLPQDWDIVRLSSPARRAYIPLARLDTKYMLVRYSKIPTSAGAYIVTQQGAKKFVEHGVRGLSFDDDLRRPWFHGMCTYGILEPPMSADAFYESSIDTAEAGRFDKGMSSRAERIKRGDHRYISKRMLYNIRDLGIGGWLACQAINFGDMIMRLFGQRGFIHRAASLFPAAHHTTSRMR